MRPKDQGTAFETELVKKFRNAGLQSRRLPEGGIYDEGDILLFDRRGGDYLIEAKARAAGNPHRWLHAAKEKASNGQVYPVALIWKRLTRKTPDQQRRTPDGERVIVCIDLDTFIRLLGGEP